ncbi:MAG: M20 family metallopeptidase [Thaumarchaeota archaeon]|nr:M20 family metallopeptidase [Nitrososphaerota archaeon]
MSSTINAAGGEEVVRLTSELVKIPSVTGKEGEAADYVEAYMRKMGMETVIDEAAPGRRNIVGRLRGSSGSPILIFNGHTDVVPPGDVSRWSVDPFGALIKDGRLYGRGSSDMKGGLASALAAVKSIVDLGLKLKGDVIVEAVVDEEAGGRAGTGRLTIDKPVKGDFVVVAEPTDLELQTAHKGDFGMEIRIEGKSAHASTPEVGVNAIHKMINLTNKILSIPKKNKWDKRAHPLLGPPYITISVIEGGLQRNMIPDRCKIVIDRRTLPKKDSVAIAKKEIEEVISEAKAEDPQLRISYNSILELEAMETDVNEPIVKNMINAISQATGAVVKPTGFRAFTDAHFYSENLGIPVVMYGPGRLQQAHSADEYVEISQLIAATKVYEHLITKVLA